MAAAGTSFRAGCPTYTRLPIAKLPGEPRWVCVHAILPLLCFASTALILASANVLDHQDAEIYASWGSDHNS